LGDIIVSLEKAQEQALERNQSLERELAFLVTHGFLHLLGYDHVRDQDATLMETIETAILGKLGVPDPY